MQFFPRALRTGTALILVSAWGGGSGTGHAGLAPSRLSGTTTSPVRATPTYR
jgi:hypothetical protein